MPLFIIQWRIAYKYFKQILNSTRRRSYLTLTNKSRTWKKLDRPENKISFEKKNCIDKIKVAPPTLFP